MNRNITLSWRRAKKPVITLLAFLGLFVSLFMWALASPLGASPDEDYHLPSSWCGHGPVSGICETGSSPETVRVPYAIVAASACFAFHSETPASCTSDLPSDPVETARSNTSRAYPPVYYWITSWLVNDDVVGSLHRIRAMNALVFVGLVGATAWLVGMAGRARLMWALLLTLVPLGMFLIPSANPSSWAIASAATVFLASWSFLTENSRRRRIWLGVLTIVGALIGAGARSDSAIFNVIAVSAALITSWPVVAKHRDRIMLPLVIMALSVGLFFSATQGSADLGANSHPPTSLAQALQLAMANLVSMPALWIGALGQTGLGWLDTPMPGIVWVGTSFAVFGVLFASLTALTRRTGLAMALVTVALIAIPLYVLVRNGNLVGTNVQPRYIYPLIILLVTIAVSALAERPRLSPFPLWLIAGLITVGNSVAIHANMQRYVFGTSRPAINLDANPSWWWSSGPSAMTVWLVATVAFAAFALATTYLASPSLLQTGGPRK